MIDIKLLLISDYLQIPVITDQIDRCYGRYNIYYDLLNLQEKIFIYNHEKYEVCKNLALAHELIHCTGIKSRLNRKYIYNMKNRGNYYKEEYIANKGSILLLEKLNIIPEKTEFVNKNIENLSTIKCIKLLDKLTNNAVDYLYDIYNKVR